MQIMLPKEKSEALGVPESFGFYKNRKMNLPRIQYITHPEEDFSNRDLAPGYPKYQGKIPNAAQT